MTPHRLACTIAIPALFLLTMHAIAEPLTPANGASPAVKPTRSPAQAVTPLPTAPPQAPAPVGPAVVPPRPSLKVDFVVDSVAVRAAHSPINTASRVFVDLSIANRGQAGAASSTCLVNLRYTKIDGRPGVTALASVAVPQLSPGETFSQAPSALLPPDLRPGRAYAEVVLDPEYAFAESDEGNNSKTAEFTVVGPDLVVASIILEPGSAQPGDEVTVQFTIYNGGGASASVAGFHINLSQTRTMDSPVRIGEGDTGAPRPPSTGTTIVRAVRVPAGWATRGAHYVQVILDPDSRVNEERENNNKSNPVLLMITS